VRHPEPVEIVQPESQFDEPQFADDAGDDFGQDFADDDPAARDEPPETEQSGGESETVQKEAAKKSSKGKEATKKSKGADIEKKRRRKADDDPPRQTKKPRSNSAKPNSQGRAKTPVETYLEGMCWSFSYRDKYLHCSQSLSHPARTKRKKRKVFAVAGGPELLP